MRSEGVEELSRKQKDLRLRIELCNDPNQVTDLKTQRKECLKELTRTLKNHREKELEEIVKEIDNARDDVKMFKAVRHQKRKRYENPIVHNAEGKAVTRKQMYSIINNHFKDHFQKESEEAV